MPEKIYLIPYYAKSPADIGMVSSDSDSSPRAIPQCIPVSAKTVEKAGGIEAYFASHAWKS